MRLEQLFAFMKIAELQSVCKAAEQLYTTSQNLSKMLISLEKELHVSLFNRTKKGMFLTDDGERAYSDIKLIIEQIELMKEHFNINQSCEKSRNLPVNILSACAIDDLVSSALNLLISDFSDAMINVIQLDYKSILKNIYSYSSQSNKPDIIVTFAIYKDIELIENNAGRYYDCYHIYEDKPCLQVPLDDVLCEKKVLTLEEVSKLPLLLYTNSINTKTIVEDYCSEKGLKLSQASKTSNLSTCNIMAFNHKKYCVVGYPTAELRPISKVKYIPIDDIPSMSVIFLKKKRAANSAFCFSFYKIIDEFYNLKKLF